MTTKFTLGPLIARKINDNDRPFAVINKHGPIGDELIAAFIEKEADATLYAAAPDMAEALEKLANTAEGHLYGPPDQVAMLDAIKSARAALQKARGQ